MKAIDFFCGGGGMTYGLRMAGIDVIAGIDIDPDAKDTYEFNNPGTIFIESDIEKLSFDYLEKEINVKKNDDEMIFVGCSPCQFYSIINTDRKKSIKTKDLLSRFAQFVEYFKPAYILVENVPGILSNKVSVLPSFLEKINNCGYKKIVSAVVDMSKYGVPQSRKRFSLIATRLDINLTFPAESNEIPVVADFIGEKNGFPRIPAGNRDNSPFNHSCAGLSPVCLRRLEKTHSDGGTRFDWANIPELQLKCFEGKDNCFRDTFARMWWNKPAPTITTKFYSISNGRFAHPEENRGLSIREGATLQTFPKTYEFRTSSMGKAAKLIGNAVPCEFARRVGLSLLGNING